MSSRCSSNSSNKVECGQSPECSQDCQLDTELGNNSQIISDSAIHLRFPIYVESVTGTTFKVDVFPSDTILQIKEQLENTEGIPVCQQYLIYHNKELTNNNTIEESSLGFGARLQLILNLKTGPIPGTPYTLDLNEDNEQNSDDSLESSSSTASRPFTILLFQNGDQIKVISITTNKTNGSEQNASNYFTSETDSSESLAIERSESRVEEDKLLKNKMNQIQNQLKTLELKRSENRSKGKGGNTYRKETISVEKLPHLDTICHNIEVKESKSELSRGGLHLPPICVDSKSTGNSSNESTGLQKQFNFIKQILMPSTDGKTVLYERRHSLMSNMSISLDNEEINRLDLLHNNSHNLISKLRPLTAPAVNDINDRIRLVNKLSRAKPGANFLSKHRSSANRSKSSRRLPPISNNSKKKVNKMRCSLCRSKLSIVNRYKCRCGLIFCAKHRYSETHFCSYDYKEEGIQAIKRNNPLLIPEKLPKI